MTVGRAGDLPTGKKADGSTDINKRGRTQTLDFKRIIYSQDEVDHARRVVMSSARCKYGRNQVEDARVLLEHLGLMPGQEGWYEDGSDTEV